MLRPGHTDRTYAVRLRMVVSGDDTLRPLDIDAELHVVEIFAEANPREIWFYSVSAGAPMQLADGRFLLFSADLSPGVWKGPGTYELGEESGVAVGGSEGLRSGAYVQLYGAGDDREFVRFDVFEQPCRLTVAEDNLTGTVDCPALESGEGGTVALHWNWERR